jgi:hypothetical protein
MQHYLSYILPTLISHEVLVILKAGSRFGQFCPVYSTIYWNDNCGSIIEAKVHAEIEARLVGMIQAPTRKFTKFRIKNVHHFM